MSLKGGVGMNYDRVGGVIIGHRMVLQRFVRIYFKSCSSLLGLLAKIKCILKVAVTVCDL